MHTSRRSSGWIGGLGVLIVLTLAWGISPSPVTGRSPKFNTIFYKRLHNMTPSAAWSPDSRYLAFHSLRTSPSYVAPRIYRRSTGSRYYRRATTSRYYRRATSARYYRRPTASRVYRRATTARIYRRATASRYYRRSTHARYLHGRIPHGSIPYRPALYAERIYTTAPLRSRLGLIDAFRRTFRAIPTSTYNRATSSAAYFRPRWLDTRHVATSTGFSGDAQVVNTATQRQASLQRLSTVHPHPQGLFLVGREPQTGVFLVDRRAPQTRYALVDKRRKIGGFLPQFSPDGRYLAWIDTNHDYSAASLKVYAFPLRPETLQQDATLRIRSPWSWDKAIYQAIELREISIPETGPVVDFVWGPQGTSIAFVRGDGYSGAGSYQHKAKGLFLMTLDGEKAQTPRMLDAKGDQPSFMPNGSLAFHRRTGFRDEIWFWNATQGGKTFVINGHEPRISPNGRYLAYLRWTPPQRAWNNGVQLFLGILALP